MVCLIQLDIKIYRKGHMNKLNKLFNSIGNNTIENEKTSLDIINEYLLLENQGKLKRNEKKRNQISKISMKYNNQYFNYMGTGTLNFSFR